MCKITFTIFNGISNGMFETCAKVDNQEKKHFLSKIHQDPIS